MYVESLHWLNLLWESGFYVLVSTKDDNYVVEARHYDHPIITATGICVEEALKSLFEEIDPEWL